MTDRRPPGTNWLSCIDCQREWDNPDALGDFNASAECPDCGGTVVKVYAPTVEQAHRYARMERELKADS